MAQLILNNKLLNNTGELLYYINYGKYARQKKVLFVKKPLEFAKQRADRLKKIYKTMRQKNAHKKKSIKRRDKKKNGPQFKKKNKIYLLTDNLCTKHPFKKLNYRKIGLFFIKIIKKLRDIKQLARNYEFDLLRDVRIYLIFDI